jgi:hypothetical protein
MQQVPIIGYNGTKGSSVNKQIHHLRITALCAASSFEIEIILLMDAA